MAKEKEKVKKMKMTISTVVVVSLFAAVGSADSVYNNGSVNFQATDLVIPTGSAIYDNGGADFASGNEMTRWLQTEDFMIGSNNSVSGATFSLLNAVVGGGNGNWDNTLEWFIFDSSGGVPGNVIASGNGSSVVVNFVGTFGWDFYDVSFDFGQSVAITAGTQYHFGLHLASDYANRDDVYWGSTGPNGTLAGWESDGGTMDNWVSNGVEHAFTLTPTPGSLAVIGFGGLLVSRRRR